ncbi:MAG: hypothetical protein IJ523_06265 [Succinivibrionaceae bacterium]|nr:hypothetical protein [Succinivibrionaceae bacterium]
MNASTKTKTILLLTAAVALVASGIGGIIFGIVGNHLAPVVLLLAGLHVSDLYRQAKHEMRTQSDIDLFLVSDDVYESGIRVSATCRSGIRRELVIDQANVFIPQRMRFSLLALEKLLHRNRSLDAFVRRMNELACKASGTLKGFAFTEGIRTRLVRYMPGTSPP